MLTREQIEFLLTFLNAIEFRFSTDLDALIGYIYIKGEPDKLVQFLDEFKAAKKQLAQELVKEVMQGNGEMDSICN